MACGWLCVKDCDCAEAGAEDCSGAVAAAAPEEELGCCVKFEAAGLCADLEHPAMLIEASNVRIKLNEPFFIALMATPFSPREAGCD